MSRSRRKEPVLGFCPTRAKAQKEWKKECNRKLRRTDFDEEIPKQYRKFSGDIWTSPSDGKYRLYSKWCNDDEWEKAFRK